MNLSYWEYKSWLSNVDFTIVGSGIVGLSTAVSLRQKHPNAKIVIIEKGILPQGASTKNAGFACFGSISEILADLDTHSEEEVVQLVARRWQGIALLRKHLGDSQIDFQNNGGHELFFKIQTELYENCMSQIGAVNKLLQPIFGKSPYHSQHNTFGFQGIHDLYITHDFESQLDTGKMMMRLLELAQSQGIIILNAVAVNDFVDQDSKVKVQTNSFEFETGQLFIATNGFASHLLNEAVQPARAQVLITSPIDKLPIKGTFHLDEGYYYFRNIDNRILLGGGRNLDFDKETTSEFGATKRIQEALEKLLKQVILPNEKFSIDRRWSGIMGMGKQKKPIVKSISNRVHCGIRLGGMGVAIGSLVGHELAALS